MNHLVAAALPIAIVGQPLPSLAPMLVQVTPAVVNIATVGSEEVARGIALTNDPFFSVSSTCRIALRAAAHKALDLSSLWMPNAAT